MSRHQLEFETVFPSALEAYRSADQLGAELGCRTIVLPNEGPDGRTSWSVYSYVAPAPAFTRRTEQGAFPVYQPARRSSGASSIRATAAEPVRRPSPRPSQPNQPTAHPGANA